MYSAKTIITPITISYQQLDLWDHLIVDHGSLVHVKADDIEETEHLLGKLGVQYEVSVEDLQK